MRPPKKGCVEDCLCLWIHRLPKGRNILRWRQGETEIASLEYERGAEDVSFRAQVITLKPIPRSVQEHRFALATAPSFREIGTQQWLICECGRKFRKLFLPVGKTEFRCRFCHNLIHRSAQTHSGYRARVAQQPSHLARSIQSQSQQRRSLVVKIALATSSKVGSEW